MHKALLILIISSACCSINAQNSKFRADLSLCKLIFTTDTLNPTDWDCHNNVRNISSGTLNLMWQREDIEVTPGWEPTVCDNVQCYGTATIRTPDDNFNVIKKGGNMLADVHVYDSAKVGKAYIKLTVFEKEDTSSNITIDYLFNKESVGTNSIRNISLRMFPNPSSNSFTVEYNTGIKRIDLLSVLGTKAKSYKSEPSKSYDISDLENGIYLVRFITDEGKILRTLKLLKR